MATHAPIIADTGLIGSLQRSIQSVVARGISGLCSSGKVAGPVCLVLLSLALQGCARPSVHEPVTLTLLDQEWTTKTFGERRQAELQQFTRETGIQVKLLPSPEPVHQQLTFLRTSLGTSPS